MAASGSKAIVADGQYAFPIRDRLRDYREHRDLRRLLRARDIGRIGYGVMGARVQKKDQHFGRRRIPVRDACEGCPAVGAGEQRWIIEDIDRRQRDLMASVLGLRSEYEEAA